MAEPLTKTEKAWVTRDRVFRVTRVHHGTQRCIYGWEVTQDHVHVALARDLSEARAVIAKVRHAERKATLDQLIEWSEAHPNAPVRLSTERTMRSEISSIESSETSITGQPSRLWISAACSRSS